MAALKAECRDPRRGPRKAPRGALPGLVLALAGGAGGCLCPPSNEALLDVGYRTPRQTLATYQTFLRADLPEQEYLCFSARFRRDNGISAASYAEGREQLFERQPWLKLLARAEVVGEQSEGSQAHWIDVQTAGRTVRVKLVREAFFEILSGRDLVTDGYADLQHLLEVAPGSRGPVLRAQVPLPREFEQLEDLSEVLVASHWKIDELIVPAPEDDPTP